MQHRILIACAVGVIACEPLQPILVAQMQPVAYAQLEGVSGAYDGFAPGQPVAARWQGGTWYVANVSRRNGYDWDVDYADGDRATVPARDMLPLGGTFAVGDHVVAKWYGAAMYPGTITRVAGWTCTVQWDDGDRPLDVPSDQIAHAP